MLLCAVCLLLVYLRGLQTDGDQPQTQDQIHDGTDGRLNGTLAGTRNNYGYFNISDLAGIRSFPLELEIETRIIGGQEAWAHSWPWQVSLQLSSTSACGGAIISPLWVVSAAHCFTRYKEESLWTVVAGKHDLDKLEEPEQQMVDVARIICHNEYNTRTKEGDVALLKLKRPLVFNQFVRPIDIWMSPLPEHLHCTTTGWGSTQENGPRVHRLQEVNVSILSSEVCNEYYKGRITQSMFCAGKDEGGVDACQGDSGGPLSCFTGTRHELAGLVSWGIGCGRARKPGVYSKVQQHINWISEIMNEKKVDENELREVQCGKPQTSTCDRAPGLAGLSVDQDGKVFVENVTETCPSLWPWMVSLQDDKRHYCSGVLIHQRWVLTARHCRVRPKEDVVILGVHDLKFMSAQTILVDEVLSPGHDPDLTLVRLSVPAKFGQTVSPICVPEEDEELDNSWTCVTAGWGKTKTHEEKTATGEKLDPDRLHHATLTLVNDSDCRENWDDLVSDDHVCSHPAGSTSCMGDAGAPLFCQKHDAYFLFGVVTWGSWRCRPDKMAIFTRVPEFHSWITDVTDDV
ncbi:ovochymase-1 isoform X2 [Melanotaenia boesemani]|uniref:ovochymase-1 isoform X2 n=1 Tax=Melanotaenia boesemani TaxID=1250792 RepID=UPI001C041F54|nr:ovochymase-1 isoform X2 [Melanotaenia boesemani]